MTTNRKINLEKQYEICSIQLERAKTLIESLGGEKGRWKELGNDLKIQYEKLTGDVICSAGMIAYLGPFTSAFRTKIAQDWVKKCKEIEIPSSDVFAL